MSENQEFDITATVGDAAGVRCSRCQEGPMHHEMLDPHMTQTHGGSWNGESQWIADMIPGTTEAGW
jgi:hypothetical protein